MTNAVCLMPGDIVLVTSNSLLSRIIRRCTRLPGEPPTRFSHAEIVVAGGGIQLALVISADSRGIRRRTITPFHRRKDITVYRPHAPDRIRRMAAFKATALRGRKYPVWRLFMHLFDRLLGGAFFFRRFGRSAYNPECAALVALVYAPTIQFCNTPWWAVTPDDIDDHCLAAGYEVIRYGVCP